MTRDEMSKLMVELFNEEIMVTREAGQQEYAAEGDCFANFQRLAKDLDLDQKKILWVYAMKHRDGIANYLNGHTSQREDVTGRIKDLIVYLFLLWGMIDEERRQEAKKKHDSYKSMLDQGAANMLGQMNQALSKPFGQLSNW